MTARRERPLRTALHLGPHGELDGPHDEDRLEGLALGESRLEDLLGDKRMEAVQGRVHVIEGELLSWYGPRIARALDLLSELISG